MNRDDAVKKIRYDQIDSSQIELLDRGGVLHVQGVPGMRDFLTVLRGLLRDDGVADADISALLERRDVPSLAVLGKVTKALKQVVRNHAFAMFMTPMIEKIGCNLDVTHVDCGVIRYQLLDNLRTAAETSGEFEEADFKRLDPRGFPEIFGYHKLPPHRDVRWPHVRIIGCWAPLTDLAEGETVTVFPDVFADKVATGDPGITPMPNVSDPNEFGLGRAIGPAMKAGDVLIFHAATVHSSPVHQLRTFRGSIDWRLAYPCIDDFTHYKSTFVQARNLVAHANHGAPIDASKQLAAAQSYIDTLRGQPHRRSSSFIESRYRLAQPNAEIGLRTAVSLAATHRFCPDSWMTLLPRTRGTASRLVLALFAARPAGYFWLFKAYNAAVERNFSWLARFLKWRARRAAEHTQLRIVNFPIEWPEPPRELLPKAVLERLK